MIFRLCCFHEPGNLEGNAKRNTLFHRAQVYIDPTYTFGIPGDLNILDSYTGNLNMKHHVCINDLLPCLVRDPFP